MGIFSPLDSRILLLLFPAHKNIYQYLFKRSLEGTHSYWCQCWGCHSDMWCFNCLYLLCDLEQQEILHRKSLLTEYIVSRPIYFLNLCTWIKQYFIIIEAKFNIIEGLLQQFNPNISEVSFRMSKAPTSKRDALSHVLWRIYIECTLFDLYS